MRTTLDIDDDVLQSTELLARRENKTAGEVLSDLARKALATVNHSTVEDSIGPFELMDGWYALPSRGTVVMPELVEELADSADLEDAGVVGDT